MEWRFVCDVHLGKLAKNLRMLGFDTAYQNNFSNADIEKIALEENRVLLSRNAAFAKNQHLRSVTITNEDPSIQLKNLIEYFSLKDDMHPFTICLVCNGRLQKIAKEKNSSQIPYRAVTYFNEFWQCPDCKRIYWKGSHYERMLKKINTLLT